MTDKTKKLLKLAYTRGTSFRRIINELIVELEFTDTEQTSLDLIELIRLRDELKGFLLQWQATKKLN